MQVTVENISELSHRMTIKVTDANVEQTIADRLKEMQPKVKMAGFRPGKVPMKIVARSHRPAVRHEVIDNIVKTSMQEAFTQESVTPASPPHIESMSEQDATFTYVVTYEVFPEIETIKLDDIDIERVTADVEDADVDAMLATLREQRATWQPLARGAKKGDGVTIDFTGLIDGKTFDGGQGTDMLVVIGDGAMLAEFEDQLIGAKESQEITITLTFPDDYHAEHLRGKEAVFTVKIKSVASKKIPDVDDEFAKICGVEGGVNQFIKEVRANMTRELAKAVKARNKRTVMDSLADYNKVDLPQSAVQQEAERLMQQTKDNLKNQGVNIDNVPFEVDNFKDTASRNLLLNLIFGKIISDNEISVDEVRVKEVIAGIAENYEDSEDVVNFYMNDQQKLSEVRMMVVEDSVVEWVFDRVKVKDVSLTFNEVMNTKKA